ncbi:hypothetical protein UFOVP597_28 [uncultured Caudovirales phage]|uniref:Uncharacterized protein n=1 Tax=uncultured Caudovirales phage TaxID=2100421 RepID=A0A6J5MYY3_9CAUD|nr:hypothetical protein UFOVP597_28 [uncultured Caudovirales phage]
MIPLFVSKDSEKGTLIYASSDLEYVKEMTEKYFNSYCIDREYLIEVVVGIEPLISNKSKK